MPAPSRVSVREPPPWPPLARQPAYPWLVVGTVCIGAFMGQLDASIAQLVVPTLETAFHARLSVVSWVALSYLLVLAGTLPIFGRLADMMGRKLLYTGGFVLFVAGSALCGFAPTLPVLISARAFQALGAALLQANSVAIVTAAAGSKRRGRAIGVQGAAQAIGLSTGPALGGLLIQNLGWRWVFWINVPAGLLGALLGLVILPQTRGVRHGESFDWWGAALLMPGLAALLLAISEGRRWGIASPLFIGCLASSLLLLVVFVRHERSTPEPLVDLSLFRHPTFTAGNVAGLLSYGILFGIFFLLPFALERGYREPPLEAGALLTAIPIALGIVAPLSGALSDRVGPRPLTAGGMILVSAALIGLAWSVQRPGLVLLLVVLAAFGLGQGLFTAPNNSAIMGAAPPDALGVAGGLLNVTRSLGTSIGVAVAATALSWWISVRAGHAESTALASHGVLLGAVHDTLLLFAVLAILAAAISLLRDSDGASGT